jgi:hypothetical protein
MTSATNKKPRLKTPLTCFLVCTGNKHFDNNSFKPFSMRYLVFSSYKEEKAIRSLSIRIFYDSSKDSLQCPSDILDSFYPFDINQKKPNKTQTRKENEKRRIYVSECAYGYRQFP